MSNRLLGCLALVAACAHARAPAAPSPLEARVDAIVRQAIAANPLAGVAVAVADASGVRLARGWGFADLENDVPVTPTTVFRIGSVTKQFTAAAILTLREAGKLELDDDIHKFLPDFPTQGHTVTIRHLLTHTSGIPSYTGVDEWRKTVALELTKEEVLAFVKDRPFDFAPGEKFKYDNTGYFLLGMIVEKVSGQSYADYLRDHVFAPAGLAQTQYCDLSPLIKQRAQGYEAAGGKLVNAQPIGMSQPFAAGALCSTVLDLLKWQRALEEHKVVSADSLTLMRTPGKLASGSATHYGFGIGVGNMDGHRVFQHNGGINGFASHLAYYPDDHVTVAVLINTASDLADEIGMKVARAALGIPEPEIKDLKLSVAELQPYVGTYDLPIAGLGQARVFLEGERLMTQVTGQPAFRLQAQGGHVFLIPQVRAKITFVVQGNQASTMIVEQGGGRFEAKRVP